MTAPLLLAALLTLHAPGPRSYPCVEDVREPRPVLEADKFIAVGFSEKRFGDFINRSDL